MANTHDEFKKSIISHLKGFFDELGYDTAINEINGEPSLSLYTEGLADNAPKDIDVTFTYVNNELYAGVIVTVFDEIMDKFLDDVEKLLPQFNNYLDIGGFILHRDDRILFYEQFYRINTTEINDSLFRIFVATVEASLDSSRKCREMLLYLFSGEVTSDKLIEDKSFITL